MSINEYLSQAISYIDEEYTEEALDTLVISKLRKKNTQKKVIAFVATMIAVKGLTKYIDSKDVNLLKLKKGA